MTRRPGWAAALLLPLVAACGPSERPPDAVVVVSNVHFAPPDVTVPAGGTVEWRFEDGGVLHQVTSEGRFDSGITGGGTYSHTFDEPGTYEYTCSVHRYMTGTVTVTVTES
ncbi:cupredoxin domain-containing protein [Rhodococcus sp. 2H158]